MLTARYASIGTTCLVAMFAIPASADPPITQFNGYSVTVRASATDGGAPSDDIKDAAHSRAEAACESVGKTAHMETMERVGSFQFSMFYVCL